MENDRVYGETSVTVVWHVGIINRTGESLMCYAFGTVVVSDPKRSPSR